MWASDQLQLYILKKINIYQTTEKALPVYKKIQNRSISSYRNSYSSPQLYKNAIIAAKYILAS